jgi:L-fucose mutarotase/ribose pyranase (RbsD/FucU family)
MSECECEHDHEEQSWEQQLEEMLPLYGHRNWIVIADAAYPAQSNPGIDTAVVDCGQIEAVKKVRDLIAAQKHVRANIYVDAELGFVAEKDAKGVRSYRRKLTAELGASVKELPHDEIIAKLDKSAEVFQVLILKTAMTIPYTSVFFELDCGYWTAAAEKRLRAAIAAADKKTK